jgi:hypothetical protein
MSGIFDQIINYSPPLIVSGTVNYKGTWNASTNTPTLNNPPASSTKGDYYVVSTAGTQFSISFAVGDWIISNGTAWEKVDLTDAVSSVFGRTGAVVGASTDYSSVGLTNTAIGASSPSTGAFTTVTASSTIAATGAVTGSNLSGTNTGDQTITLTGGVTGSGTGSFAATVVTNANLTGDVTSVGNATTLTNAPVIAKVLTGYVSGAGTVAATDSILQAIQKLNGNDATNANLTGAVTSVGNATSLGSFSSANLSAALTDETGSGAAVFATSPTLVTPNIGVATGTSLAAALNGSLGATTPSTVAATTLSASSTGLVTGTFGVGAAPVSEKMRVQAAAGYNFVVDSASSSLRVSAVNDADSANVPVIFQGSTVKLLNSSGDAALLSGGGLAVTGALSSTGLATFTSSYSSTLAGSINMTSNIPLITWQNSGTGSNRNFMVANGYSNPGVLTLAISGSAGGAATTILSEWSSTGLAVTTGNVGLAAGTLLTLNGNNTAASYAIQAATAAAPYDFRFIGDSDSGTTRNFSFGYYASNDKTSTWNPKVTINSYTGNVGIGTTAPARLLSISGGASTAYLQLCNTATGITSGNGLELIMDSAGLNATITNRENGYLALETNGTERARIDSSGNLLVGQTTTGAVNSDSFAIQVSTASIVQNHVNGTGSGAGYTSFAYNAGVIGSITQNGTTGVLFNTSSDYRLKVITGPLTDSGTFIDALKPKIGTWKSDGSKFVGFVAHEFAEVCPSAVTGEKDAVDSDGKPVYQAMQASSAEVIANLVAELQSVRARLATLEAK